MKYKEITIIVEDIFYKKVKNAIFILRFSSGTKNKYHIFFSKTNEIGISSLKEQEIKEEIEDTNHSFIMDYNGSLENINPNVRIYLLDKTEFFKIQKDLEDYPLSTRELLNWGSRKEFYDYVKKSSNYKYKPYSIDFDISQNTEIKIELKLRFLYVIFDFIRRL